MLQELCDFLAWFRSGSGVHLFHYISYFSTLARNSGLLELIVLGFAPPIRISELGASVLRLGLTRSLRAACLSQNLVKFV